MVSKIKLRFTISAGEKSRVPFGTDGLIAAMAAKVQKRGNLRGRSFSMPFYVIASVARQPRICLAPCGCFVVPPRNDKDL